MSLYVIFHQRIKRINYIRISDYILDIYPISISKHIKYKDALKLKPNDDDYLVFINLIYYEPISKLIKYLSNLTGIKIIYNFEAITNRRRDLIIKITPYIDGFLDYSYNDLDIGNKYKVLLPKPNSTEICPTKENQIVFIGKIYPRRKRILNLLSKKYKLIIMSNKWGIDRDKILYNTKILVNIHANNDYHTFESIRCVPCMFKKVIVISEKSINQDKLPYSKYIVWVQYDEIISKVSEILDNYDQFYANLFKDFDPISYDYDVIELMKNFKENKIDQQLIETTNVIVKPNLLQ